MKVDHANSFEKFVAANAGKVVTEIDYVHTMSKALDIPMDFVACLSRFFWPELIIVDGNIFVSQNFSAQRYDELLKSGQSHAAAQYWINLVELTGVFDDYPHNLVMDLAVLVVHMWNAKIHAEYPGVIDRASVIDDESGEIYVTIGSVAR